MEVLKLLFYNNAIDLPDSKFTYSDINNGTFPKIHETLRGNDLVVLKLISIYSRQISTSTWWSIYYSYSNYIFNIKLYKLYI